MRHDAAAERAGGEDHHCADAERYTPCTEGAHGGAPVMGSVGDAYDNAMCESFFASLECELLQRTTLHTQTEGRMAVFQYIEGWYNTRRRHSGLDYQSPISYERKHLAAA